MANKTEYTRVIMDDQTEVSFPGSRQLQKTASINDAGQLQVRFDFRNGEFRVFTIPESLLEQFALHGASQKLGDQVSGIKVLDDAIMAYDELADQLATGLWAAQREASAYTGASILAKALAELSGKDIQVVKETLKATSHEQKMVLRGNSKLKPIIERLEAEKQAKSKKPAVNSDELLDKVLAGSATDTTAE